MLINTDMEINEFIGNIKELFEETDTSKFDENTGFRLNDEYSSLTGMAIIAMVDDKYKVTVTGNELRQAKTIKDLYNIVNGKKKE